MAAKCSRIILWGMLALLAIGCGGSGSTAFPTPTPTPVACAPTASQFAYVLTGNSVSMFTADSCTGAFTATTPASIATGPNQFNSEEMVADRSGKFAYVANLESNASPQSKISMYTINPTTGVLTPTTPATVPTGWFPQGIAISPSGKFVYTANTDDNTVSMFTADPNTGVLTPTTPAAVASGSDPVSLTVDPSNRFVYCANRIGSVSMYTINAGTGLLSPMTPATVSAGVDPFGVAVDSTGKFAYVPDNGLGRVWQYTIDPTTGILKPGTPPFVAAGQGTTSVAVDPTSKFVFATNRIDNTVSMYTVNSSTGNLTPNGTIATGNTPFRMIFDPSGKFLYVVNESSAASVYTINPDGTLKSAGMTGPAAALSIAITSVKP